MSRLLTLLLLYRSGYMVGKYISIEMIIEKFKDDYYDALQASSFDWITGENDYKPFIKFYLRIILNAYKEFEKRTDYLKTKKKPIERVLDIFNETFGKITKKQIVEICPDIPVNMIELYLKKLLDLNYIKKIKGGRYSSYVKVIKE